MKNKFAIISVAVIALATVLLSTPATAQQTTLSVPAVLAAGTTNLASPPTIDCRRQQNVGVSTIVTCSTAGATNIYYFGPCDFNGSNVDTNTIDTLFGTNSCVAGVQSNNQNFNLNTKGFGYYSLFRIVTTGTATNGVHAYGVKANAP